MAGKNLWYCCKDQFMIECSHLTSLYYHLFILFDMIWGLVSTTYISATMYLLSTLYWFKTYIFNESFWFTSISKVLMHEYMKAFFQMTLVTLLEYNRLKRKCFVFKKRWIFLHMFIYVYLLTSNRPKIWQTSCKITNIPLKHFLK